MKFAIKKIDKSDPKKFTEEEVDSPNEATLKTMYDTLGYFVEVINVIGTPTTNVDMIANAKPASLTDPNNNVPFMPPLPGQQQRRVQQAPTKEILFENGGVQFKIISNGDVYKKDWTDIGDHSEYRLTEYERLDAKLRGLGPLDTTTVKGGDKFFKLEKLDWVKIQTNNENKKDKPNK